MKSIFYKVLIVLWVMPFLLFHSGALHAKSYAKPKHYVFLIHGIGGDRSHFGYTDQALVNALKKKDPSVEYGVITVEYDTSDDDKTLYDLAKDVNVQIQRFIGSAKFKSRDKFSLIMHSQGGLIGMIWVFESMRGEPGFGSQDDIRQLDAFITLATPFWGAQKAVWGKDIKENVNKVGIDLSFFPFGLNQLKDLSYGSDIIFDFRDTILDPDYSDMIQYLAGNVRFLNIAGIANITNPTGMIMRKSMTNEDDGAVPLPSARFDFLYNRSVVDHYDSADIVALSNMKKIQLAPYVRVKAVHRSFLPELRTLFGIAQVPKRCISDPECDHPAFPYLWNHILGNEIVQLDDSLDGFYSFLLDINVRLAGIRCR